MATVDQTAANTKKAGTAVFPIDFVVTYFTFRNLPLAAVTASRHTSPLAVRRKIRGVPALDPFGQGARRRPLPNRLCWTASDCPRPDPIKDRRWQPTLTFRWHENASESGCATGRRTGGMPQKERGLKRNLMPISNAKNQREESASPKVH